MMYLSIEIIAVWFINGVTKIKLLGIILYKITEGSMMNIDMNIRLMVFLEFPKMVAMADPEGLS